MSQEVACAQWHTRDCTGGEIGVFTGDATFSKLNGKISFHWQNISKHLKNDTNGHCE